MTTLLQSTKTPVWAIKRGIDQMTISFPAQNKCSIKHHGKKLHPILWQGELWSVTEYGIESRDGAWPVCAKEVIYKNNNGYNWIEEAHPSETFMVDDLENCLYAFSLLFDANGNRNTTPAPRQLSEIEIEEYAFTYGNAAYESAKSRAMRGEV